MQIVLKSLFIQIFLILVFCTPAIAQNLIENAGFENGITGWSNNINNDANANFIIEINNSPEGSKHFKCEVLKPGTNDWDLQIQSNEFTVNESHNYRLTFKAKSSSPTADMKVFIQNSFWMGKSFTLDNSWELYTYDFIPNESTKQLKFNFLNIVNYYIDDIVIEDITAINSSFNTPPSCVITNPHVNAYYKRGSEITINAYSSDKGGSGVAGEISKVEFYIDEQKIGESNTAMGNTYFYKWTADNIGEYRVKAIATDNLGKSASSAGVIVTVGLRDVRELGLSAGKGKYLGNNVRNSGVEPDFTKYWNSATSGNGGKWATVEGTRDVMKWENGDNAYNLATFNNLPYRYHTLAWGSQYPKWIETLNPSDFQEEMEEFMSAVASRYRFIDQIDVINEPLPGHQEDTKYFIDGLGGAGESGYDWAVWLFKKAREYFPNSKLVLNDYGMVNNASAIRMQQELLKVLRDSALLDGFGAQAHTFNLDKMNPNQLKQNLDLMANSGVPIYITEMDMQGENTTEASQLESYETLFPVLWEHPDVAGITLWGYIYGNMWKPNAGLVYENGTERSSMVWLKNYMDNQEDVGYPFSWDLSLSLDPFSQSDKSWLKVYPNPAIRTVTLQNSSDNAAQVSIYSVYGRLIDNLDIGAGSKVEVNLSAGMYLVKFNNHQTTKLIVGD